MIGLLALLFFLPSVYTSFLASDLRSTESLIIDAGYKAEAHKVVTADQYILTIYRIVGKGPVVFMQHGMVGSSTAWLLAGPDHGAPAFRLAEEGYDVWLGNFRGNHESRLTSILVCIRHVGSIRFSIPTRRTSSGSFHKMRCQNMICHLNSTMCCSSPTKRRKEFICGHI